MNFSAVILAGGKSSRMGRDKAFLEIHGQSLLSRQLSLARETGAAEIFISGRADTDYSAFKCPVILDEVPDLGPLAGIASALNAANFPLLVVLAVDMPNLTAKFLKKLLAQCSDGIGAVPVSDGLIEPLAAFYPKSATSLIREIHDKPYEHKSPGGQDFAKQCARADFVRFVPLLPGEIELFKSLNSPADSPS